MGAGKLCLNCQTPLHGAFCSACGQEERPTARSLKTLLLEVFEGVTNLDGRGWRTIRALLLRPGLLTVEYLADRRARYLPPFRLYLVISVLFFALGLSEGGDAATTDQVSDPQERRRECEENVLPWATGALRALVATACRRSEADGSGLAASFLEMLPRTLFLFLPLVALVLLLLFGRARRFYVEHLVFTLHVQAAVFLAYTVKVLMDQAEDRWSALEPVETPFSLAILVYLVWYVFRALRVVYGQSWRWTALKLLVLAAAYSIFLLLTVVGTAILTLFQARIP